MSLKGFSHVRHRFSPSEPCDVVFADESLTQQHFRDQCDVNYVMRSYEKTGLLSHTNQRAPVFGDFSDVGDYQAALNQVMEAQESFLLLDPYVRARFSNDPGELISFLQNPLNRDEAIKLGLINNTPVGDISSSSPAVVEEPPK